MGVAGVGMAILALLVAAHAAHAAHAAPGSWGPRVGARGAGWGRGRTGWGWSRGRWAGWTNRWSPRWKILQSQPGNMLGNAEVVLTPVADDAVDMAGDSPVAPADLPVLDLSNQGTGRRLSGGTVIDNGGVETPEGLNILDISKQGAKSSVSNSPDKKKPNRSGQQNDNGLPVNLPKDSVDEGPRGLPVHLPKQQADAAGQNRFRPLPIVPGNSARGRGAAVLPNLPREAPANNQGSGRGRGRRFPNMLPGDIPKNGPVALPAKEKGSKGFKGPVNFI